MPAPFHAFGPSHQFVLAAALAATAALLFGRHRRHRWPRAAELALGWAVGSSHFLAIAAWWWRGVPLTWDILLPMHLCNWAGFATCIALIRRSAPAAELAWFWGMSGTIQGVLTPNQPFDWPDPSFLTFFLLHAGVVIGAIHLVFGMGLRPRPGAWLRAVLHTEAYLLCAAAANLATGANYAFLRAKPAQASLMDHLGPWPWYLLTLQLLGALLFFLLYLPFRPRSAALAR